MCRAVHIFCKFVCYWFCLDPCSPLFPTTSSVSLAKKASNLSSTLPLDWLRVDHASDDIVK